MLYISAPSIHHTPHTTTTTTTTDNLPIQPPTSTPYPTHATDTNSTSFCAPSHNTFPHHSPSINNPPTPSVRRPPPRSTLTTLSSLFYLLLFHS
ncbi:hypothetical protein E2C01_065915 [Portunus trituberculatus]|uniref:Uncharacterized protein n=1 Tax=Portunus trituberculatus TaxID=210409 RepID=A0A5B7HFU6_PORTR|nr:hypothetical protein [Portunus trituberculatus]